MLFKNSNKLQILSYFENLFEQNNEFEMRIENINK